MEMLPVITPQRPDVPPYGFPNTWGWRAAPGWPDPGRDWRPHAGWQPDPSWPGAPEGWVFWVSATQVETTPTPPRIENGPDGPGDPRSSAEYQALKQELQDTVQTFADQTMRKLSNLMTAITAGLKAHRPTREIRAAAHQLSGAQALVADIGDNPRGDSNVILQKFVRLDSFIKRTAETGDTDYHSL